MSDECNCSNNMTEFSQALQSYITCITLILMVVLRTINSCQSQKYRRNRINFIERQLKENDLNLDNNP